MSYIQRTSGLFLVSLAAFALLSACTTTTYRTTCRSNSDCGGSAVCELGICRQGCIASHECPQGEVCQDRYFSDGKYCGSPPHEIGRNNNPTPNFAAMILDTSVGVESCDVSDPGSDLIFVALEDSEGEPLGYGSIVVNGIVSDSNDFAEWDNLRGDIPSFRDNCPEFSQPWVTSLGCGGYIAIEFWNDGTPVGYFPGMKIRVFEFGETCGDNAVTDEYEIFLCSDIDAVKNHEDLASCTTTLGRGSGETAVTIPSMLP